MPLLEMAAGEPLWRRQVRLLGAHSGRCYALGLSFLRLDVLPRATAAERCCAGRLGIGELLRESTLEATGASSSIGHVRGRSRPTPVPAGGSSAPT